MAVRFSSDFQNYTRTVTLGAQTAYSISCWVKLVADRDTYSTVWTLASTTSNYGYLQTDPGGSVMGYYDHGSGGHRGPRAMTLGVWYWWGVAINGAAGAIYSRAATDATTTATTWGSGGVASITQTTLYVGESIFASEYINGSIAAFKWWGANLSRAEMENESHQTAPYRTVNLRAWYPFDQASTVDYSGAGATLTGGSGAVTEDGPPIPWAQGLPLILPSTTPFSDLVDEFTTDQLASKWPASNAGASVTGGRVRLQTNTSYSSAITASIYAIEESSVYVQAFPAAAAGASVEAFSEMVINTSVDGTDAVTNYNAVTNTINFWLRTGYFDGSAVSLTYDPIAHAWWRIRVTSGTMYWDTSADGTTWTNRRSTAAPAWALYGRTLRLGLTSRRNNGTDNYAEFDNFNTLPSVVPVFTGWGVPM